MHRQIGSYAGYFARKRIKRNRNNMYVGWKLFNNIRQHLVASMWDGSSDLTLYCRRLVTKAKLICGLCNWNVFMFSLFTFHRVVAQVMLPVFGILSKTVI